jgi:UDP-N-acetylglucosamine--N-acetylmuramyl-(pentapeptide) pyrophosphoryl-undecaprenol N-acetylglucosamine transferase
MAFSFIKLTYFIFSPFIHPRMSSAKRTVYISACGIGLGHIGRDVAVADILRDNGVECVFSTYGPAYKYITAAGYKAYDSPVMMWDEYRDGSIAVTSSVAKMGLYIWKFGRHMEQERRRLAQVKPDAVLIDTRYSTVFATGHYPAPHFFLSNQIRFLMPRWQERYMMRWASNRITRANHHWLRRAEAIFFPDFPPPDTISRDNAAVPERLMKRLTFVGPIYRAKPEDFPNKDEICRRNGFEGGLFVYAAVSGPGRTRAPVIDALKTVLPEFDGKSLIVKGDPSDNSSEWINGKVNVRGWTDNRFELLKASSVVVSRPGLTTLSELARFGKPCVLIPIPTQSEQEGNARSMANHGVARVIDQSSIGRDTLREALDDIVRRAPEYEKNARRLKELAARHDGARKVAERMLEHLGR